MDAESMQGAPNGEAPCVQGLHLVLERLTLGGTPSAQGSGERFPRAR
jgi:hypothetical protein